VITLPAKKKLCDSQQVTDGVPPNVRLDRAARFYSTFRFFARFAWSAKHIVALEWFRVVFSLEQERSTKLHEMGTEKAFSSVWVRGRLT
jgi:hypothetical protein